MCILKISHPTKIIKGSFKLPGSKSESNRALIINALSGGESKILNLSESRDTQTMLQLLNSEDKIADVGDAGTTMRFLLAYFAATEQNKILTGTERMCYRPIGILADCLQEIGFELKFLGKKDFPPIEITGKSSIKNQAAIKIRSDVSSQFISALLMIAPTLSGGLRLELENETSSKPYIDMTLSVMKHFGISFEFKGNKIFIPEQKYLPSTFAVEPDWSAASYWFSMAALADVADIFLEGMREKSFQGDAIVCHLMKSFGVNSFFTPNGLRIVKSGNFTPPLSLDFKSCPDLAQTFAVLCAAKGHKMEFTGIENLAIKETDRIAALDNELKKFECGFSATKQGRVIKGNFKNPISSVQTYNDHRMAMAFAPLAILCDDLMIENPDVVKKSYPMFWDDLRKAGFMLDYS